MQQIETSSRPPAAVMVEFEYGALRETIVGRVDGFRLAKLSSAALAEYAQILPESEVDFLRAGEGQLLEEYAPDFAAALESQVEGLVTLLKERGVTVHRPRALSEAEESFPGFAPRGGSLLFMRDPILVISRRIIDLAMRFHFRRRQRFALREIIESRSGTNGVQFLSMPEPLPVSPETGYGHSAFLEGGDVLLNGQEIYVGVSGHASSASGAQWLQNLLGSEAKVLPVPLADGILHLDCALSIPRPGLLIACLDAFLGGLPGELENWEVIDVTYDEARLLACNGLILDANTYVLDQTHMRLADRLASRNFEVITVPFDLPARFGGGLRCVHHPLVRS